MSSVARTTDASQHMPDAQCPSPARPIQREGTSRNDAVATETSHSTNWWMVEPYLCRVPGFHECKAAIWGYTFSVSSAKRSHAYANTTYLATYPTQSLGPPQ